jgi:acyl carrier protein
MNNNGNGAIEAKLAAYVVAECLPKNSGVALAYDQNLFESGIVDSAGLVSYIGYIEREFNLAIPDEDLLPENFKSIAAIADYIRKHTTISHVNAQEMHHLGS